MIGRRLIVSRLLIATMFLTSPLLSASPLREALAQSGDPSGSSSLSGNELWRFPTGDSISASPAVVDGMVYVGSFDDYLYAVDAVSGTGRWRFPAGAVGDFTPLSSPSVVDGVVYIGSFDGLYAIDAATGSERWRFAAGEEYVASSPAVVDGVVYIGSGDGNLYAVDAASGAERWRFAAGEEYVASSPAVVDGVIYVAGNDDEGGDDNLYALDAATGTEGWHFGIEDEYFKDMLAVSEGLIFVVGGNSEGENVDHFYAVDSADGTEVWSLETVKEAYSLLVEDGIGYLGGYGVYAFNASTGDERWEFEPDDAFDISLAVVEGVVYVGSDGDHSGNGTLYAVDAVSGFERWHFMIMGQMGSPVIADGVVYVGGEDGNLYAIEPPAPEAIATQQAEQAWDAYFTDVSTALRTFPDVPAGFTGIAGGQFEWPVPNPIPEGYVGLGGARFTLPAAPAQSGVFVARYDTPADAERAAATAVSGLTRAGWSEVEVGGVEHDHTCLALASAADAKAVCYVERDDFVLVTYSYLTAANVDAATTNATDLAVYANAVFDRVPRPAV